MIAEALQHMVCQAVDVSYLHQEQCLCLILHDITFCKEGSGQVVQLYSCTAVSYACNTLKQPSKLH